MPHTQKKQTNNAVTCIQSHFALKISTLNNSLFIMSLLLWLRQLPTLLFERTGTPAFAS